MDYAQRLAVDSAGNSYLTSKGDFDVFLSRLDLCGNF